MVSISNSQRQKARLSLSVVMRTAEAEGQWATVGLVLEHLLAASEKDDSDAFQRAVDALQELASGTRGSSIEPPRGEVVADLERINELISELEPRLGPGPTIPLASKPRGTSRTARKLGWPKRRR